MLKAIFTNVGATVQVAETVKEASSLLSTQCPHLIITDLQMQPQNGFEVIKLVRSLKNGSEIPIVVLSSINDTSAVYKAVGMGIQDYLLKPIKVGMLLRKARKALKDHDLLKFDFPKVKPEARLAVRGRLHSFDDIGIRVESSVCLVQPHLVYMKSTEVSGEVVEPLPFAVHRRGISSVKSTFINEIIAISASKNFSLLRRLLDR